MLVRTGGSPRAWLDPPPSACMSLAHSVPHAHNQRTTAAVMLTHTASHIHLLLLHLHMLSVDSAMWPCCCAIVYTSITWARPSYCHLVAQVVTCAGMPRLWRGFPPHRDVGCCMSAAHTGVRSTCVTSKTPTALPGDVWSWLVLLFTFGVYRRRFPAGVPAPGQGQDRKPSELYITRSTSP